MIPSWESVAVKREKKRKRKLVSRSVDVGPRVLTMNSFLPWWQAGEGRCEEKKREKESTMTSSKRCERDDTIVDKDEEKARKQEGLRKVKEREKH